MRFKPKSQKNVPANNYHLKVLLIKSISPWYNAISLLWSPMGPHKISNIKEVHVYLWTTDSVLIRVVSLVQRAVGSTVMPIGGLGIILWWVC